MAFASVWIVRSPLAVAMSLTARDGLAHEHGLALWDVYVHRAFTGLVGHPVCVVVYDELVTSPIRSLETVQRFANRTTGLVVSPPALDDAAATIHPSERHEVAGRRSMDTSDYLAKLEAKYDSLVALRGIHVQMPARDFDSSPEALSLRTLGRVRRRRVALDVERGGGTAERPR